MQTALKRSSRAKYLLLNVEDSKSFPSIHQAMNAGQPPLKGWLFIFISRSHTYITSYYPLRPSIVSSAFVRFWFFRAACEESLEVTCRECTVSSRLPYNSYKMDHPKVQALLLRVRTHRPKHFAKFYVYSMKLMSSSPSTLKITPPTDPLWVALRSKQCTLPR